MSQVFGLYIHYPYCSRVCPFCDFVVAPKKACVSDSDYLAALCRELELAAPMFASQSLATIYFGGGTPSLMPVDMVAALLEQARRLFYWLPDIEVTLEVDPQTAGVEKLRHLRQLGVTRLSLGLQSLRDELLDVLGRGYTMDAIEDLLKMVQESGFTNCSADLMFGIPQQTLEQWLADLHWVAGQATIHHLSLYNLTVAKDGRFMRKLATLGVQMPPEELQIDMLTQVAAPLTQLGFERYEITAWAKPGFQSQHNANYWRGRNYLGIGVGAHSYLRQERQAKRWHNLSNISRYKGLLRQSQLPQLACEELTPEKQAHETMILRLRQSHGISQSELSSLYDQGFSVYKDIIDRLTGGGYLCWLGSRLSLTAAGVLVSDEIFAEFCLTPLPRTG